MKASQRLRNAFQMAMVSCYMMVLFAQPAAAADTMWTRFQHDYRRCLWRAGGHLHHRGSDCGCGGAAGADDLTQ